MKTLEHKPPVKASLDVFLLHITYPHDGDPLRPRYQIKYKLTGILVYAAGVPWQAEDFETANDFRNSLNETSRPWRHQVRLLEDGLDRSRFSIETLGQKIQAKVELVLDNEEWVVSGDDIAVELHLLILGGAE